MKAVRRAVAIAAALWITGGALLTGPASAQTPDTAEPVIYDIGWDSDITSLNPFKLCCGMDFEYLELVYDLGITYSPEDLSAAPKIITEWTPSEDHLSYTMKVRTDAMWHDGEPLTADDVAFTFNFISKYQMGGFYSPYFPPNTTFEVVDEETVIWHSEEPTLSPETPAYAMILPEHIWGRFDDAGDPPAADAPQAEQDAYEDALADVRKRTDEFLNETPVGSGPFIFDEYVRGQYIHLVANPDYWGGTPSVEDPAAIDEIYLRFYGNIEAMTQALRAGELDFANGLTPALFNSLEGQEGIGTHVGDGGCWGDIAFNFGGQAGGKATNHPALQDLAVRQAIAHSVDKQEIVEKVYQGTAVVGDSFLAPAKNAAWYLDIPPELEYPYDPATANQILDDAGYLDTDGDGVREMPGGTDPLKLEFIAINDVDGSVGTGQLLDGYLREIGIEMLTTTVDSNKATEIWGSGEFDALIWDWCPDPGDGGYIYGIFATEECNGTSNGCYSNPEYDALYAAWGAELDPDRRASLSNEMQELIATDLPEIVLNYWTELQAYRETFTGYHPTPNVSTGVLMFGYGTSVNYLELRAVTEEASGDQASSSGLTWWVPALVGAGGIAIAFVLIARRGRSDEDEE